MEKAFKIPCDTVLLSVGLVPENELSRKAGVAINPMTNGAWTDSTLMTAVPGIFACGNVLHVHDLVDYVVEEAQARRPLRGRSGSMAPARDARRGSRRVPTSATSRLLASRPAATTSSTSGR